MSYAIESIDEASTLDIESHFLMDIRTFNSKPIVYGTVWVARFALAGHYQRHPIPARWVRGKILRPVILPAREGPSVKLDGLRLTGRNGE
jgi:hypothetical protein